VNEHEAFLHRRRARRQARAAASSTQCSTTLAIGLKDDGNGTEETKKGLQKLGKQRIMKEAMALKEAHRRPRKRAAGNNDKIAVNEQGATTGY